MVPASLDLPLRDDSGQPGESCGVSDSGLEGGMASAFPGR